MLALLAWPLQLQHLLGLSTRHVLEVRAEAAARVGAGRAARCFKNGDELRIEPRPMPARLVHELEGKEPPLRRHARAATAATTAATAAATATITTTTTTDTNRRSP